MTLLDALARFLFHSFIGWWILFLAAAAILSPLVARFRGWRRRRRFLAAQAVRLENPDNAEVRAELADLHLAGGGAANAERYAREAVEAARRNPLYEGVVPHRFLRLLGQVLYRRRRYAEATESFRASLKAKSEAGYHDALLGLSKSLWRSGRPGEAAEFARHAIQENSSSLEAYFRWAQAAAAAGAPEQVRRAREEFLRVKASLPPFARRRTLWYSLAFAIFPLARRLG